VFTPNQLLLRWHDLTAPERRIPKTPRRELIFARDGFACQYCGSSLLWREATIDHLIPASTFADRADAWTWENLVTACRPCNAAKADTHPSQYGWPRTLPVKPRRGELDWYFNSRNLDRNWIEQMEISSPVEAPAFDFVGPGSAWSSGKSQRGLLGRLMGRSRR
jgi:hypothetical protein